STITTTQLELIFFFSSRRRHTRSKRDWSSDVCSSDLGPPSGDRPHGGRPGSEETPTAPTDPSGDLLMRIAGGDRSAFERLFTDRSEERRVGKEGRSQWSE